MAKASALSRRTAAGKLRQSSWTQDPEGVKRDILDAARQEFVENGLSGARVDEIAARTATSKRMIYYYFGDKEGLYRAVLEAMYDRIRSFERDLDLASLPPREAMVRLVEFTFDYHVDNPDFVRMVMVENVHHARNLRASKTIAGLNRSVVEVTRETYRRGVEAGLFKTGYEPLDIHLTISALSIYNVSHRATVGQVFGYDMCAPEIIARRRAMTIEAVLGMLRLDG
ncbi:TetR/AcrR family transcriptional regulator [Bosea sp. (in: a-proteobacteria)]|uniref:TetR/AcrR family transcriptional regulator n=1 Tax=Bosea sp. (in: a-proteobacteria) TaxID=1871050 RepID=UPI00122AD024|nr:TetR/AcrR family transcriptional regulator [Bosea sp. (in: a-proteobacteria)]TAJ28396.1 MAG: TetR/AcrR family transcriptional regulator [Bosea sp. (in: a-proteobacteria)]